MEVGRSSLLELLGTEDVTFRIPAYQRRYAWQHRQCEELWLDVLRAGRRGERHFAGTVLYEEREREGGRELSLVDGQQRLTTVVLMLVALRNHLRDAGASAPRIVIDSGETLAPDLIDRKFLTTENPNDESREPKLQLSRLDAASMAAAIAGAPPEDIPSRNIAANLAYFQQLMESRIDPDSAPVGSFGAANVTNGVPPVRKSTKQAMPPEPFDAQLFADGLNNLVVALAQLEPQDDSQAIFESLNSKGLKLNIGDMVRNYLLASETHDEQTRLYIEYWTVIEGVFDPDPGSLKLDTMIKAWLSVRFTKVRARTPEEVYSAFKRYYDDEYAGDLEPVLAELRSFAMVWAENYRYHAVKKFRSMAWAKNGPQTLTSGYELKPAYDEEYAERVRAELRAMGREL